MLARKSGCCRAEEGRAASLPALSVNYGRLIPVLEYGLLYHNISLITIRKCQRRSVLKWTVGQYSVITVSAHLRVGKEEE